MLWVAAVMIYYFVTEALVYRTLGKALLGLRVVRAADGGNPGPAAIAGRLAVTAGAEQPREPPAGIEPATS